MQLKTLFASPTSHYRLNNYTNTNSADNADTNTNENTNASTNTITPGSRLVARHICSLLNLTEPELSTALDASFLPHSPLPHHSTALEASPTEVSPSDSIRPTNAYYSTLSSIESLRRRVVAETALN